MGKGTRREVEIKARRPWRRAICGRMGASRLLLALAVSAACGDLADAGAAADPAAARVTAITDVRIIDGNGGTPVEHGTLLIEGDRIAAAGPATQVRVPPGARRVEGHGRSALPGLADMHLHLLGGVDGVGFDLLGYQKYLNALLYAGVTTVMDTGNVEPFVLQLRAEVAAGRVLGPRIYCVGPILDGAEPVWPALSFAITSKDQVPRIVAGLAADRVDFIKLYVGLSDMLIRTISAEAGRQGLRTIIDQWSRNGSADIAAEGIAGFAHFPSHRIGEETLATIKAHHVFLISTLAVQESALGRRWLDLSFLDNPLIADTTPRSVLARLRQEYGGLTAEQLEAKSGYTMKVDLKGAESNVPRFRDAGVLFAAGTDAVYPGDFQGEGLHRELELLVESGLSPLEALTAATRSAATIVHGEREWGTLEPGMRADIILIDGRPDQRISDSRKVSLVMKQGRIVDRAALRLDQSHIPDYAETGSSMAHVW